jgi:hypothetical protein
MEERAAAVQKYATAIRGVAEYAPRRCAAGADGNSPERGYLQAMTSATGWPQPIPMAGQESRTLARRLAN